LADKKLITRQNFVIDIDRFDNPYFVLSEKNILSKDPNNLIFYQNIVWENEYFQLGQIKPITPDVQNLPEDWYVNKVPFL